MSITPRSTESADREMDRFELTPSALIYLSRARGLSGRRKLSTRRS